MNSLPALVTVKRIVGRLKPAQPFRQAGLVQSSVVVIRITKLHSGKEWQDRRYQRGEHIDGEVDEQISQIAKLARFTPAPAHPMRRRNERDKIERP